MDIRSIKREIYKQLIFKLIVFTAIVLLLQYLLWGNFKENIIVTIVIAGRGYYNSFRWFRRKMNQINFMDLHSKNPNGV